jgi:hypothetical protein
MRYLKQSTATTLLLGPFLDATDGVTSETALTISQSDVLLWKEGGTTLAQKNESTSCTHRSNGLYTCPVNTTDTATLGTLVVSVSESGAMPIRQDYTVVPANWYDSNVLGTDVLEVDLSQIDGVDEHVEKFAASVNSIAYGTVDTAGFTSTTTEFETSSITTAAADHWIGRVVIFNNGTLAQQATVITDYVLSSGRGHFTVTALTSAPANAVQFVIV